MAHPGAPCVLPSAFGGGLVPARQLEHPEGTTLGDRLGQIGHVAAPQRYRTTVTGGHADVLFAVLFPGDGRRDDPGADLELPQLLAVLGVEGLEVAVAGTGEHQVALGGQYTGPQRQTLLVFPYHFAGGRVHRPQDADVVVIQALDAEAHAQVGGAFLVVRFLGPVVLLPVVGRYVEQAGVLAVGHRVPVLATAEGRRDLDHFTLGFAGFRLRRTLAFVFDRATGFQVDVAGPGDLVAEGEGVLQLAVGAVDHVEETVAVGVGGGLGDLAVLVLVVEQHQLVVAGEVPGIVRGVLVEPLHFTGGRVDADLA